MQVSIVIPCYNELNVVDSVQSIANCSVPESEISVVVVVNNAKGAPSSIESQNRKSIARLKDWSSSFRPEWLTLHVLEQMDLPPKTAGVGTARKIGMDYATQLATAPENLILVCYDADCTCSPNYLRAIEAAFLSSDHEVGILHFEHNISYEDSAIADYELFLRYHVAGLRFAGYPYAFHTVGSSMAVRASTYLRFGGMNRRKAGEDFYFLHKLIPYTQVTHITSCKVIPSSRDSDRVPFGTGHAVAKYRQSICSTYYTYDPAIYEELSKLLNSFKTSTLDEEPYLDSCLSATNQFLRKEGFETAIAHFRKQCKTDYQLQTSLYRWLNGPRMLKLVHFLRDTYFINIPLNEAVTCLWKLQYGVELHLTNYQWLGEFREIDKNVLAS
ncbi:MAG: glycosyltransferase family 2 protein [Bacteroidia bacterium]|nr:glycosyltransferase family 2 protein [Bacteroidia bacterium]